MFDSSNKSVSISVTDDESDELTRLRVRSRRKRKNPRVRVEFTKRAFRWLCRYWMVLVLLPAAGLLLFEATRIGMKSKMVVDPELNGIMKPKFSSNSAVSNISKPSVVKKQDTSLNRLDPTTRVVAGVRERCLKLLPPEELEHLDIPVNEETNGHVKNITYMSDSSRPFGLNSASSWQRINNTRFNLFTGNQTFEERERSFKVNATTTMIHCGFYSENGGFRISEEDKAYMQSCKVVVSTCAFGGGDDLYQPIGMSKASIENVCYVAFWDEITLAAQKVEGHEIGETGFIGIWRIVVVHDLPFVDQRLNGKIPKMLSHRLFPYAMYSIWVDSKSQFRRDPLGVIEALLWRSNSELAISEHGARSSVYDEANAVVKKHKATPEEVEVQITQYRLDGLPEDKRFNGKKALCEASVIVRKHSQVTNLIMCLWFNEVVRFTSRDQLSFPYVLWRLKVVKNINMFPVCTRKDMVNSMGHIRKAKPLIEE